MRIDDTQWAKDLDASRAYRADLRKMRITREGGKRVTITMPAHKATFNRCGLKITYKDGVTWRIPRGECSRTLLSHLIHAVGLFDDGGVVNEMVKTATKFTIKRSSEDGTLSHSATTPSRRK